jgi:hypothetical protein
MKSGLAVVLCLMIAATAMAETNWNLQQVNSSGVGTHPSLYGSGKVTVEGYILNRSEYMLDGTPNYNTIPYNVGAQWQIYVQGNADANDHGGTAIYMGQNYENLTYAGGVGRYTNDEWLAELDRLNHDPRTGHRFMPGDKVRVTGLTKYYNGKTNINERHNTALANDITIELTELGAGLPTPEVITLDQLKDASDAFRFDSARLTGGEYYQARLVRINDVNIVNPSLWAPNATLTITHGTKTLPLKLGMGPGITVGSNNLPTQFDVIGILDQEGAATGAYRLWVTNYDGNGLVLADGCDLHGVFALGDINKDCVVNFLDFAVMADEWLQNTSVPVQ